MNENNQKNSYDDLVDIFVKNGKPVYGYSEEVYTEPSGDLLYWLDSRHCYISDDDNYNECFLVYKGENGNFFVTTNVNPEYAANFIHGTMGLEYHESSVPLESLPQNYQSVVKQLDIIASGSKQFDMLPVTLKVDRLNDDKTAVLKDFIFVTPAENDGENQSYFAVETEDEMYRMNNITTQSLKELSLPLNTLSNPVRIKIDEDGKATIA